MLTILLVLSGCLPILQPPNDNNSIEDDPTVEDVDVGVIPSISSPEDYYRSILYDGTYPHGEARGVGTGQLANRIDLDQFELGLTRIAQEFFPSERYFFREGQFLRQAEVESWISRETENNPNGLNPSIDRLSNNEMEGMSEDEIVQVSRGREEEDPSYLSHLLEHNYLVESSEGKYEVGGIVIGLSLKDTFRYRVTFPDGRFHVFSHELNHEEVLEQGKEAAEKVLQRLRSDGREDGAFNQIPIVFALFQEQPPQSAIPGNFVAHAKAEPNGGLSGWQTINEQYYLFPSTEANRDVRGDADAFNLLREDIQDFFSTYVGVVGRAFYNNENLQELTIDVSLQYQGKTEIIAISQFIASRITQRFPESLKVNVYLESASGKQEAMIIRSPNSEPELHINQ